MRNFQYLLLAALLLQFMPSAPADTLFTYCPTLFNTEVSNITANTYFGSPPSAGCGALSADPVKQCNQGSAGSFNVLIDGDSADLLGCTCSDAVSPGSWRISISTPLSKEYNVTTYTRNTTGVSAEYSCLIERKSFESSFTVPELPLQLLPFLTFAAILILRKRQK